jgi:hypothetical protein
MSEKQAGHAGGCHCGAVRYEISGEPQLVARCHCRQCQKASGAGHVMHLGVGRDQLRVEGQTSTHQYIADSGAPVQKHFCPSCGTNMFGEPEGMPGFMTVAAATLDDSSMYEAQVIIFTQSQQPWDREMPGLASFEGLPPRSG